MAVQGEGGRECVEDRDGAAQLGVDRGRDGPGELEADALGLSTLLLPSTYRPMPDMIASGTMPAQASSRSLRLRGALAGPASSTPASRRASAARTRSRARTR